MFVNKQIVLYFTKWNESLKSRQEAFPITIIERYKWKINKK